jgi:hypothetical protein
MNITSAQYSLGLDRSIGSIKAIIDGTEWSVPLAPGNRHYDAIMAAVEAGELTIQEADAAPEEAQ